MKYRLLPRTGWKVSVISYGCMSLSIGQGAIKQKANQRLLEKAADLGINFFDTADLYDKGENEITVGKALKTRRKELFIATKVGNQWRADGSGWDWNPSKQYILKSAEESLRRLQTDYIDLYQLHGGTIDDPIDETIEAFELLKEQGKIREYGISSIRPNVIRTYVNQSNIVSVMMQYSLLDRRPEESCLPLLQENDIGVLVRGAVAKGLLIDKPAKEYLGYSVEQTATARDAIAWVSRDARTRDEGERGARDEGRGARDEGRGARDEGRGARDEGTRDEGTRGRGASAGSGRTAAMTALQFALKGPAVYSVAAGMRTQEQLMTNIGTTEVDDLNANELNDLRSVLEPKVYEAHR